MYNRPGGKVVFFDFFPIFDSTPLNNNFRRLTVIEKLFFLEFLELSNLIFLVYKILKNTSSEELEIFNGHPP